jgi:transposase
VNPQEEIIKLKAQIIEKDELINELFDKNIKYLERIEALEKKVNELVGIIQTFTNSKPPKDSTNSNKPPSSDIFRSNRRTRRVKSGKKPGGQPGHEGHHLEFNNPDQIINHIPDSCINCGALLDSDLAH